MAETKMERYYRLKRDGICVLCAKEKVRENYVRCKKCRQNQSKGNIKMIERRLDDGVCVECGLSKQRDSVNRCDECCEKQHDATRQYQRWHMKQGLCTTCPNPAKTNRKQCEECLIRMREAHKRWVERKRLGLVGTKRRGRKKKESSGWRRWFRGW